MDGRIVCEFARLRVLTPPSLKMDALVHDLNVALELDENNTSSTNNSGPASTRRRVWRRRCKSTSNLASLNDTNVSIDKAKKKNSSSANHKNSDDTSSSTGDENRHVIATTTADRGTSSLQLSDSDDEQATPRLTHSYSTRRKKQDGATAQASFQMDTATAETSSMGKKKKGFETDSVNENFSPVRPSTKRKRKFKRMALDPDNTTIIDPGADRSKDSGKAGGTLKRKKVRSRSACEAPAAKSSAVPKSGTVAGRQRQMSATVVPGKRKRSSGEKSVEPDNHLLLSQTSIPSHSVISEEPVNPNDSMECDVDQDMDERRSSSSISSSDSSDELEVESRGRVEDDGEADDEQSDWPGPESVFGDDDFFGDSVTQTSPSSALHFFSGEDFDGLTSTARQAYLARMKRLADCVPGREIRAGSRKLRNPQIGFTIKSSSSEQLSRFLQDPSRTEMKLTVLRLADRNKVAQMANLYSLELRYDGPNVLILSKTGKTVKVDHFIVPKAPAKQPHPVDVKRRRRTPPPNADAGMASFAEGQEEVLRRQSN